MIFSVVSIFLVCFAAGVSSQKIEFQGGCPAVAPMKNFNIEKYYGKWYEQERFFPLYDPLEKCVTDTISKDIFFFKIDRRRNDIINPLTTTTTYTTLFQSFDNGVASLFILYFFQGWPIPIPYHILDTDYTSYSIAYSCLDLGVARIQFQYVLTRARFPAQSTLDLAYNGFKARNVSLDGLIKTEQFFCDFNH